MTIDVEIEPFTQIKKHVVTDLNRKALWRQIFMSLICVTGPLIAGACYSQPSITLSQLKNPNETVYLSDEQSSWYGKFLYIMFLMLYSQQTNDNKKRKNIS